MDKNADTKNKLLGRDGVRDCGWVQAHCETRLLRYLRDGNLGLCKAKQEDLGIHQLFTMQR